VIISTDKKQYPVSVKLHSRFRGYIRAKYQKDKYVWRLNADHLRSKRRMANQEKEVKAYQEYLSKLAGKFEEIEFTNLGREGN